MSLQFDLNALVFSLSDALDLVGINDLYHGKRVAYMALETAAALGWSAEARLELREAALLHDLGVSRTGVHVCLVEELDWHGAEQHCIAGAALLGRCPPLARIAPIVRHHHTHWADLAPRGLPRPVAEAANLIYLADSADALIHQARVATPHAARERVRHLLVEFNRGPPRFRPEALAAFLTVSERLAFWFYLEPDGLAEYFLAARLHAQRQGVDMATLRCVALLFSHCVDAKSPYTARHSRGVARLARALGEWCGLAVEVVERLEIAGLLHDLGKLRVPDEILEKPGPLTPLEQASMARHSFDSWRVLKGIEGLRDIAGWCGAHHEHLDGHGYPFAALGEEIPLPARILAVADIVTALAEERPYRRPLPAESIGTELQALVASGHLDPAVVAVVTARLAEACEIAYVVAPGVPAAATAPTEQATPLAPA
jgi:HD-GYP domain-containing protein (c-di-GMP phosphodiesterase class II)